MSSTLLEVSGLGVTAARPDGRVALLRDITLVIRPGESVGIVGASGAGKSTLGAALVRLLPRDVSIDAGSAIRFEGEDLLALSEDAMRSRRGRRLASVFQEPLQALDPAMRVGDQLAESLVVHSLATADEALERAIAMLARVGFADAARVAARYPHEFSGGMRQRILIAAALLPGPALLIADEPTTALDTTIQAEVLDLLDALRAESEVALVLVSHDVAVVGERCERLVVLDAGRIVEEGPTTRVFSFPESAAARRIVAASARHLAAVTATTPADAAQGGNGAPPGTPLLAAEALTVRHADRRQRRGSREVTAVDGVDLAIAPGEAVGLVGESGCGKSSLAHALLRVVPATGRLSLGGTDLLASHGEPLRRLRRRLQLVPQDAGASLTPHLPVGELIAEAAEVHGIARGEDARRRAETLLADVGLGSAFAGRLPHRLSSGERQRVAIARALATEPELLVCDEPVAAVDAPTRELLLDLLDRLRRERGLGLLFISHDLASVARIASRVLVMYLGHIVESGPTASVLAGPRMPYTQALLAAVPTGDPAARAIRRSLPGEPPSPHSPPSGCPFHPRCAHPARDAQCARERPTLRALGADHHVACWKA